VIRPKGDDKQLGCPSKVSLAGSTIQLSRRSLDFTWHSLFGFDPFPLHTDPLDADSRPGPLRDWMTVGAMRLLRRDGSSRALKLLGTLSLATIWLDLNFLVLCSSTRRGSRTRSASAPRRDLCEEL